MASGFQQPVFQQRYDHSILDREEVLDLYHSIHGYEDSVAQFWDQRYALDFPAEQGWQNARQTYTHLDVARNRKKKMDGFTRKWAGPGNRWVAVVIREDKKDKQRVRVLENQAMDYATIVVEERQLYGIHVQTTLGKLFRTWYFDSKEKLLTPLFGEQGHDPRQYIEISTPEASVEWTKFVLAIKEAPLLMQAPTLKSQVPGPTYDMNPGSSTYTQVASYGDPSLYSQTPLPSAATYYKETPTGIAANSPDPAMGAPLADPTTYSIPGSSINFSQANYSTMSEPAEEESQNYDDDFADGRSFYGAAAGPNAAQYPPAGASSAMEVDAQEDTGSVRVVNESEYTPVTVTGGDREWVKLKVSVGRDKGKRVEVRRAIWQRADIERKDGTTGSGHIAQTSKSKYLTFDDLKGKGKHRHP